MDCAAVSFTQTEINSNMITVTWCGEGKWWCWVGPWVEMGRQARGESERRESRLFENLV